MQSTAPPPPPPFGQSTFSPPGPSLLPLGARRAVMLINAQDRCGWLEEQLGRSGLDAHRRALADAQGILYARMDAEWVRWRGQMQLSEEWNPEDWNRWYSGPFRLFLAEGRRGQEHDQWFQSLYDAAARQPAARGQPAPLWAPPRVHDPLWPQPQAHGQALPEFGLSWSYRGDLSQGSEAVMPWWRSDCP